MTANYSANLGIALNNIYLTCIILFAVGITYNHIQLMSHKYSLDYYEGGMLDKRPLWRKGKALTYYRVSLLELAHTPPYIAFSLRRFLVRLASH